MISSQSSSSLQNPLGQIDLYFLRSGFRKHMQRYRHCLLDRYILVGLFSYNLRDTTFHFVVPSFSMTYARMSCSTWVQGVSFRLVGIRLIILVLQLSPLRPGMSSAISSQMPSESDRTSVQYFRQALSTMYRKRVTQLCFQFFLCRNISFQWRLSKIRLLSSKFTESKFRFNFSVRQDWNPINQSGWRLPKKAQNLVVGQSNWLEVAISISIQQLYSKFDHRTYLYVQNIHSQQKRLPRVKLNLRPQNDPKFKKINEINSPTQATGLFNFSDWMGFKEVSENRV